MNRKPSKKKTEFRPNAAYSWEPTDEFVLTGLEIDAINKALSAIAQDPVFQRHAVVYEGLVAFTNFFKTAVEEGAITEKPNVETPKQMQVVDRGMLSTETATGVGVEVDSTT
jgi:hypothetical protein